MTISSPPPALQASSALAPPERLAVGVCTYKRLPSLLRCLQHVDEAAAFAGRTLDVIVVDNDGKDSAVRAGVEAFGAGAGHCRVHYQVEPTPGIASARNAVFAKAQALAVDAMAMLDDDEWPTPQWLAELLAEQQRTGAVVVGGPVRPVFPNDKQALQAHARFWAVDRQQLHGRVLVFCSCNFLVDLHAITQEPRPLFDVAFGLSGGEDVVFFKRLFDKGCRMAWAERAVLLEEVPADRATLKWMRARKFGVGSNAVRWERPDGRIRVGLKTLMLLARLPLYPLLRREPESPWLGWLLEWDKVRGRVAGHFGVMHLGYARPDATRGAKICR
jgi:succinoglycan biosynthesis protein ExoM